MYCRTWLKDFVNNIEYSWRNTIDSALFFDTVRYGNDANEYSNVSRALLMAAVLAFVVLLIVIIIEHNFDKLKRTNFVFVLIGGCFLLSLSINYVKLRLATDVRAMQTVGSAITQMYQIEKKTDISNLYSDIYVDKSVSRYKMMQLAMPEYTVHVRNSLDAEEVSNMFIIAVNYKIDEAWAGEDCYLIKDFDFENSKTTVIVKGEELYRELEKCGIELEPLPQSYTDNENLKGGVPFMQALKKTLKYQLDTFR